MATLERDILDKVGKYNLQELSIISYSQDKEESKPKFIDIKGITLTLSITEDIFSNSLSGNVVVYDMQDIRTIFPLTGLERLSLKLNTILKVIFFVLVLIGIILILPRFGFNPLALVQKVLPLLGML